MSGVLDEITKTLLRLGRKGEPRSRESEHAAGNETLPLPPSVREGSQFGRYLIESRIGSGGMGHVYLATDSRLKRKVALKFLSPALASNADSLRRLEAEAQTASALNHPNILTIYEVGELKGHHYIASEYVEGQTLRMAINRKTVDVQRGIDIMCQVLSALAAAHAAGIVHRDLKPGNIMIRPDGYVKVIDFGLAKRTRKEQLDLSAMQSLTRPGLVVGTVQYMSPEQACGDTVDQRTDIWSAGIILFEILARRRPFDGESESRIVRNICSKPLPDIPRRETFPAGLLGVIDRALKKDPDERFQSAQEMLDELSTVGLGTPSVLARSVGSTKPKRPLWPHIVSALAVLVLVSVGIWWMAAPNGWFGPHWFKVAKVRQVTFNGRVILSSISPDGKYLAYTAGDPQGIQAVYLLQLNGAAEAVKIPPRRTNYVGLSFSPDDQLFAVAKDYDELIGRAFEIPMVGNVPDKPFLVDVDGPIAFSPDGSRLAFVRWEPGAKTRSSLIVARRDGSDPKTIFSTTDSSIFECVAWSPKKDQIAAILLGYSGTSSGRYVLNVIDVHDQRHKSQSQPLPNWGFFSRIAWDSDGRSLFLTAAGRDESAHQAQVHQVDLHSGAVSKISTEIAGFRSLSVTADAAQLAVTRIEPRATLWVSDPNRFTTGQRFSAEVERRPTLDWFSDTKLITGSLRGGYPNLWLFDANTGTRESLTRENLAEQEAVAIRNSNSVVFVSPRSGQFKLWRFDADSKTPVRLTADSNLDSAPSVSPDGKWIAYTSWSATTPHIALVPASGGVPSQLGSFSAKGPVWSPDGSRLLCTLQDPQTRKWSSAIVPVKEPDRYRLVPHISFPAVWSPRGKGISFVVTNQNGVSNVWETPLTGTTTRPLTAFNEQEILRIAWSPSGDRLACLRSSSTRDVEIYSREQRR